MNQFYPIISRCKGKMELKTLCLPYVYYCKCIFLMNPHGYWLVDWLACLVANGKMYIMSSSFV